MNDEAYIDEDIGPLYMASAESAVGRKAIDWLDNQRPKPIPLVPPEEETTNWLEWVAKEELELATQVVGGMGDAINETLKMAKEGGDWLNENAVDLGGIVWDENGIRFAGGKEIAKAQGTVQLPEIAKSPDIGDNLARGMSQFLTAFVGPNKALKGIKFFSNGKRSSDIARAMTAGAAADFSAFDPQAGRFADLLKGLGIQNDFIEWLSTDEGDGQLEGRLKNALEGIGLGAAAELTAKGFRAYKSWFRANRDAKAIRKVLPKNLADQVPQPNGNAAERVRDLIGDGDLVDVVDVTDEQVDVFLRGTDEVPSKAININLARIESTDDIQRAITQTADLFTSQIDEARRGAISLEQSAALADDMGMTVTDLLKRNQGEAFNAEQAIAARKILASSSQRLSELARLASGSEASPETLIAFRQALSVQGAIQAQVSGMTAEAGRALSSFRHTATQGDALLDAQSILDAVEASGGGAHLRDMASKLLVADSRQLNRISRELARPGLGDMFKEVWINGLLSNPATHGVNTVSNAMTAVWQIPERYLASGIGLARGRQNIPLGEGSHQLYGMVRGFQDGMALAWKTLKTGEPSDPITKIELAAHKAVTAENLGLRSDTALGKGVDLLADWSVRLPGRLLMTADELFKAVGYRMELHARAYRIAAQEGLQGDDLAKRITDIMSNTQADLKLDMMGVARYQTFQNELGQAGKAVQTIANSSITAKMIMPFVRTPINIAKFTGQRTPLGFMSKNIRAQIAAGGPEGDLALARIGLGTFIMGTTAALVQEGQITGSGPLNRNVNKLWRESGRQPHSIRVGDTYYSYNRLDPMGMLLGLTADAVEIMQYADESDEATAASVAAAVALATVNNVTSKTYLSGVSELFEVLGTSQTDPEAANLRAQAYLTRLGSSMAPATSLSAQITRTIDPTLRETSGLVERLRSRTPGLSSSLPPRRNLWGDPIVLEGGLGWDFVSPIYTSTKKKDKLADEILANKIPIPRVARQINGLRLTSEEYDTYTLLAAGRNEDGSPAAGLPRTLREEMRRQMASSAYQDATGGPEGGKAAILQEVAQKYRAYAKERMSVEFPDLAYRLKAQEIDRVSKLQ